MDDNVECTRCGHRWHAPDIDDGGDLPEECPRCYRATVQEIPPEPTLVDKVRTRITAAAHEVPKRLHERRHQLILWKENHRYLLDMAAFGAAMLVIFALLYIFIFVWQ